MSEPHRLNQRFTPLPHASSVQKKMPRPSISGRGRSPKNAKLGPSTTK
jgi:hypothetical protein